MFAFSLKSTTRKQLSRSSKPRSRRKPRGREMRIENLEPRLAMNGTWATPAGTLSLDSNLNLWLANNSSPTPALVAQNVETVKVGNGSNYAAFVTAAGALERIDTSQPGVGPVLLARDVGAFAVDPIEESATPSGNSSLAGDFSPAMGVSSNSDTYALTHAGSLEWFPLGSSAPIVAGNFATGSPLVVDGSGSPVVLDRGNNHLYRYIVGSGVWSDIGNFAAGSPLVVDGSGSPVVLDRGNNHLYRYIVGSGVWSDIGNFAAGSPLVVDGSGSPVVLDRGNNHLYRYILGSGGSLVVTSSDQQVGTINGTGDTTVNDGASLIANQIIQDALVIGSTGTSSATVTIAASDASGNPLDAASGLSNAGIVSNSGVWSDIGNFAAGSPLVVDGSGSPVVLDRGNNHLYRYIVGSGVWSDIGNFGANSVLQLDPAGSLIVLDGAANQLLRYAADSSSATVISNNVVSFQIAPNSAIYFLKSNGDLMCWSAGKTTLIDVLVLQYSLNTSGTVSYTTWFKQNLIDSGLRSLVYADYLRGRSLTRSDMLGIFTEVEADRTVSAGEFHDLKALVANPTLLSIPNYVAWLAAAVINGDGDANQPFEGRVLGNLAAGDTGDKLSMLVGKWFLGTDHPSTISPDTNGTYAYQSVTGVPLFSGNGPSYQDVQQGYLGDCWLLASFAAIAARNPTAVTNMFIDNHDGTYTVHLNQPDAGNSNVFHDYYTTVDSSLPLGGFAFGQVKTYYVSNVVTPRYELWAALLEKAFAQTTEEGWLQRSFPGCYFGHYSGGPGPMDSYSALSGGYGYEALAVLAGAPASFFTPSLFSTDVATSAVLSAHAGDYVVLDTHGDEGMDANGVVGDHVYAVVGVSGNVALTLFNPWGMTGTGVSGYSEVVPGRGYYWAQRTLTLDQIDKSFIATDGAPVRGSISAFCSPISNGTMLAPWRPNDSLRATASPTAIAPAMRPPIGSPKTESTGLSDTYMEHKRSVWSAIDYLLEDETLLVELDRDLVNSPYWGLSLLR